MNEKLIDWDFLEELSGGDAKYKYDVISIFLETVDVGLENLEQLINTGKDYEAIFKQAHALKSSAGIIKVHKMYDYLLNIENLGRDIVERGAKTGQEEIKTSFEEMMVIYKEAHVELEKERDKNKPA